MPLINVALFDTVCLMRDLYTRDVMSLNSVKCFAFVVVTKSVPCEVRTEVYVVWKNISSSKGYLS